MLFFLSSLEVYKQAMKNLINTPELDAKYVKKNKLKEYLPQSVLKLEPKEPKLNRVRFVYIIVSKKI